MKKVIQKVLAVASLALCFGLFGCSSVFAANKTVKIKYTYYIHVNNQSKSINAEQDITGEKAWVRCDTSANRVLIDTNAQTGIRLESDYGCGEKKTKTAYVTGGHQQSETYYEHVDNIKNQLKDGGITLTDSKPEVNTGKYTTITFTEWHQYAGNVSGSRKVYGSSATVKCKNNHVYVDTNVEKDVKIGDTFTCGDVKAHEVIEDASGQKVIKGYYYSNVDNVAQQFKKNGVQASYNYDAPAPSNKEDPKKDDPKNDDPKNNDPSNPDVPGTGGDDPGTGTGVTEPDFDYDKNGEPDKYDASILTGCSSAENGGGEGIICIINLVVDIMTVGVGILSVIGITIVGIQYLTAGGSEERTKKAKRRMLEIVIGVGLYVVLYVVLKWLLPKFG